MMADPTLLEILDIDDTSCTAHGGQFWHARHDERGFASMHIYLVASGTPVVPGAHPEGHGGIKRVTARMRRHWPKTRIVWRGDSHYGPR
jgi:hypothetical protein